MPADNGSLTLIATHPAMPEIVFKGKEYVYNHHLTVPYRPLVVDTAKGIGPGDLNSNLVIHGDNLHALKALLPRYAGRVDLVFIDPPYNTGNEGWCYSDGVNSPIMKEWLSTNPVDGDDMLRHDKWLCMMWPRLVLLRELMSETGSIWITLDDNEVHRARMVLDEIFGADNFVATCIWQKNFSPKNTAQFFSEDHDYVLVYAKDKRVWRPNLLERTAEMDARYSNPDNHPRGPWTSGDLSARNYYSEGTYPVTAPSGRVFDGPPPGRYWGISKEKFLQLDVDNCIWWGEDGNNMPRLKRFQQDVKQGRTPQTLWFYDEVGHTQDAKKTLIEMGLLKDQESTITPKPVALIERILELSSTPDSIVLDSFAGSGTTAHAVLKANARDNGNRRFILIEGEDYADRLTAERVRRAIRGYAWQGTQHETLLEEKINFTQFKKADQWLAKVEAIKAAEGFGADDAAQMVLGEAAAPPPASAPARKKRFDKINVELKDGVLRVEGEKRISQMADGLGGEFTYCTLGEPLSIEKLLSGQDLPSFEALGAWLLHTATGGTLQAPPPDAPAFYLSEAQDAHVWLVYRPDLAFLKSADAALTLPRAQAMAEWGHARQEGQEGQGAPKRHLVFAPAKYLSNAQLRAQGIEFAALPFALFRQG
ncbi:MULTISPECIES: DNA methyltransferase [unclassified Acidovorax]|uniref:site-specific DNA-methyltransferase n=1 Tax=unclassified Acidovorax TaxID=2684926 RepID=UPI0025B9EC23|nr:MULTISPECIES: DNA methyltransferase [unclassified Acidovorax]HQS20950.1 DNA methyltransferase [Acidovorax defluvii]HQS62694.1 DNA methyltransferase [Acidovorax defluvii]HQT16995.1 DNA methyltransferase [Acidovorax defluvii]HQT49041.1 DNA methyltransferase [Acidovorax defluvii]